MSSTYVKGKGDVVAISLPNIPQYLVPALGTIHAGTVFVSIEVSFSVAWVSKNLLVHFPRGCWKK
jgi:acyl-coenzyme A synthetase/AMP-(fatty) acid ligase